MATAREVETLARGVVTRRSAVRRLSAVAALGAAGVASAGCARGGVGPTSPAALKTDVTVSFLQSSGQVETDLVNQVVERWKQAHPNGPKAEFVIATGTITEKYNTMLAGGTAPALVSMDAAQGVVYADRGEMTALDEFAKRDHYDIPDYIPASLEQYRWKGKLYALLRDFSHQAMWVNTDLLATEGIAQPAGDYGTTTGGWSFDQMLDITRRLTKWEGGASRATQYGMFVNTDITGGYGQFVWANGGELFDKDYKKCTVDDERCIEALQLMQDLRSKHRIGPDSAGLQELKNAGLPNNAQTMFFEGLVAFAFFPVARIGEARKSAKGKWDLVVAPQGVGKGKRLTSGGGVGWYITKSVPCQEEAWALMQHLTSVETHKLLADVRIPGRKSVLDWWLAQSPGEAPKSRNVARTGQEAVHSRPVFPLWDRVDREVFSPQLVRLWENKATAKDVAREMAAQANRIMSEAAK